MHLAKMAVLPNFLKAFNRGPFALLIYNVHAERALPMQSLHERYILIKQKVIPPKVQGLLQNKMIYVIVNK